MKKILILLVSFGWGTTFAQDLRLVEASSTVGFQIKNFGLLVEGSLKGLKGTIRFNQNDLTSAYFDVSVSAETIYTGIDMRDSHLRKEEYFYAEKYPEIKFKSEKVTLLPDGKLQAEGFLSIKGVSKKIVFPFDVTENSKGLITFQGSFDINRRDFGVGGRSMSMADELRVLLSVSARPAHL